MKKLVKLVILTAMVFFACSCGNSGGQESGINEKDNNNSGETEVVDEAGNHFSYRLLGRHIYCKSPGVTLCGNSSYASYFDDWYGDIGYSFDGLVICYDDEPMLFDDEEDYYNDFIYDWAFAMAMANKLYQAEIKVVYPYETIKFSDGQRLVVTAEGDTIFVQKAGHYVVYNNNDTIFTFVERRPIVPSYNTIYSILDKNGVPVKKGDTLKSWEFDKGRTADYIMPYLNEYVGCMPECINGCQNGEIKELFKKTYYDLQEAKIFEPRKGYGYRTFSIEGYNCYDKYGQKYGSVTLFRIKGGKYPNIPDGALGIWFGGAPSEWFWELLNK